MESGSNTLVEVGYSDEEKIVAIRNPDVEFTSEIAAECLGAVMRSFQDLEIDGAAFMGTIMRIVNE